jgi:hypothetical protein
MHLDGNRNVLERNHKGEREHPAVAAYRARLALTEFARRKRSKRRRPSIANLAPFG